MKPLISTAATSPAPPLLLAPPRQLLRWAAVCSLRTAPAKPSRRPNPIAVSTYSFWRFRDNPTDRLSIEQCIDEAARMGFDAVEILHIQMFDDESPERLQRLKRQAFVNGLDLCGFLDAPGVCFP